MNLKKENKKVISFFVAFSMISSIFMPTINVLATENIETSLDEVEIKDDVLEETYNEEVNGILEENAENLLDESMEFINGDMDSVKEKATDDLENEQTTVTILGTTDLHGRFVSYDYAMAKDVDGGLDQIATLVKEERLKDENLLLVDNGDAVQGNYNHLFVGSKNPMITAFNKIGYDVLSFGNHEFNQGLGEIDNFMTNGNDSTKLNFLCGNLYKDGKRTYSPYVIKESNGVKVAIIGVVAPNIVNWDAVHLAGYETTNPALEVKKVINEIKANEGGADLYFVTAHMGLENEYGNGDSAIDIANENPEVSGIIAGHSHTLVENLEVNNAVISQPKNNGEYLSKFEFTFEKDGDSYKVVNKTAGTISTSGVKEDEEIKAILSDFHNMALNDANKVIGTLDKDLAEPNEIEGIPESYVSDQGVADLVNKVQLYYSEKFIKELNDYDENAYHVSGSALTQNSSNLKAGDITKAGIAGVYKFDNKLYTIETTGKQLKKYLEWSAEFFNTYNDGDLTISFNEEVRSYNYDMLDGVKYEINISKPVGSRIENLSFERDGKSVEDTDKVYLTVNDYRYNSVLNAKIFDKGEHKKVQDTTNDTLSDIRDMIADYIENVSGGKIQREVDNNWRITGNTWNEEQRALAVEAINSGKISLPTSIDGRTPNVKAVTWNDVKKALNIEDNIENTSVKTIDILTINDLHGNIVESGKNIGAAKLAAEIKRLKNENKNTIFVGGGDLYQGTAISNLLYGEPVSKIIEEMGMKYSAVGNHEFDWGLDKIEEWSKYVEFLAANIYDKNTNEPVSFAKPYAIEEIDGVKIGFIGIATPETAYKTSIANVKDLEFKDPVEITNTWAKYLKEEENVDFVIALTHLGGEQDSNGVITGEAADLANNSNSELLDGIICAHTHAYIEGEVNNIPIVQGGSNGRALGKLQITIDEDGASKVTASYDTLYKRVDTLPVDETVQEIVNEYLEDLNPILSEVVATVDTELSHDRSSNGVTKLGQFMTKYMAEVSDVQIAVTNSGGLRKSLNAGDITVGDMWDILPFDNTLVTMKLKGSDLKRVIEHGIMNDNVGWIQFYGLNVYYDSSKEYGNRITYMELLDGTKIEMDKYYSVVTNDFMYEGGDNYDFTGATEVLDTQVPIRDALMVRFKELKNIEFNFDQDTLVDGEYVEKAEDKEEDKEEDSENTSEKDEISNGTGSGNNNGGNTGNGNGNSGTVGGNGVNTQNKPSSGNGSLPHTGIPAVTGLALLLGVGFIVTGKKLKDNDDVA